MELGKRDLSQNEVSKTGKPCWRMNEGSLGLCTRLGSTFRLKQELVGEVPTKHPGMAEEIRDKSR